MKIKLPRKRKKACIKTIGRSNYHLARITAEVLMEEAKPIKDATKFPKTWQQRPFKATSYF
jgi:hypothetical protein